MTKYVWMFYVKKWSDHKKVVGPFCSNKQSKLFERITP